MRSRSAAIATALAALLLIGALVAWWLQDREDPLPDPAAILARIESVQLLRATEFVYREVVFFDEQTRFFGIPAGQQRILFSVNVSVVAGIDLAAGVDVRLDEAGRPVRIVLPAPRIVAIDADESSIEQYFVRERLGRIDWLEVSREVETLKERNRADALDRGILRRAEVHARAVIGEVLAAAGAPGVEIEFRSTELRG